MPVSDENEVRGRDGLRGKLLLDPDVENVNAPWTLDWVEIELEDGRRLSIPGRLIEKREDGSFWLPIGIEDLPPRSAEDSGNTVTHPTDRIVPVVAESVQVGKREVKTGSVRIHKRVERMEQEVDLPLYREEVDIERVPVAHEVVDSVRVRYEDDTLIVPLLEEVLVVERKLRVREELHIKRKRVEYHAPEMVLLRREEATIERASHNGAGQALDVK